MSKAGRSSVKQSGLSAGPKREATRHAHHPTRGPSQGGTRFPKADHKAHVLRLKDAQIQAPKPSLSSLKPGKRDGDARWEGMLQGLVDFQRQHHSFNVPQNYRWNDKSLYEWCRNNRKHFLNGLRGKKPSLNSERIRRLREIGFVLDRTGVAVRQGAAISDKRWDVMFKGLIEFHQRYGSFAVPIGYMCDGRSLRDWLRNQRKVCSNTEDGNRSPLARKRIHRLISIGIDLDPTGRRNDQRSDQERWDAMFQGLLDFGTCHGSFVIPEGTMCDNRNLCSWAHNQKRLYLNTLQNQQPSLLSERVEKLRSVGFLSLATVSDHSRESVGGSGSKRLHVESAHSGFPIQYDHQNRRARSRFNASGATHGSCPYEWSVTTEAERSQVPKSLVAIARAVLADYQSISHEERSAIVN